MSIYICSKVQSAIRAFLAAQTFTKKDGDGQVLDSDHIVEGIQRDTQTEGEEQARLLPCCICICQTATSESTHFSGNWVADATVEVRTKAWETTESQHHDIAAEVLEYLSTDEIADNLSSAMTDFTAFQVVPVEQGWTITSNTWISRYRFTIKCCGSEIS